MNVIAPENYIYLVCSIIISILCVIIGIMYFHEFFHGKKSKDMKKMRPYFKYNTILTLIFNILCASFVTAYFMWICIDPLPVDLLYFFHESHTLRIVITVFWYVSKIPPFLIFNGRLKYAFKSGRYGTKNWLFILLNAIVIILTPISLTLGYLGVFIFDNEYLEWIGFNAFRIVYIVLLLILSWLFNKRMFIIIIKQTQLSNVSIQHLSSNPNQKQVANGKGVHKLVANEESKTHFNDDIESKVASKSSKTNANVISPTAEDVVIVAEEEPDSPQQQEQNGNNVQKDGTITDTVSDEEHPKKESVGSTKSAPDQDEIQEIMEYLNIVVKSSLLLTFMIISKFMVMIVWFLHNYQYDGSHYSLTAGFVVMGFDSLVDEICVVLLYKYSNQYYSLVCGCTRDEKQLNSRGFHSCFSKCCTFFATIYSNKCYKGE